MLYYNATAGHHTVNTLVVAIRDRVFRLELTFSQYLSTPSTFRYTTICSLFSLMFGSCMHTLACL